MKDQSKYTTDTVFLVIILALLPLLAGCENSATGSDSIVDYEFETLYGSWVRSGKIGSAGVSYLDADDTYMIWTYGNTGDFHFTYDYEKTGPAAYTINWYAYDTDTGLSEDNVSMVITLAFEDENNVYLVTNGRGAMTMTRDES